MSQVLSYLTDDGRFPPVSIKDGSGTISLPELRRACQKRHGTGGGGWMDGWALMARKEVDILIYLEMFINKKS